MTMIKVITPPAEEPITLAEAKLHLRVDHADEDALIEALIAVAREKAEHLTGRALVTQTLEWISDVFPDCIRLWKTPLQSVTSIKYLDAAGNHQTLSESAYWVDSDGAPARIVAVDGQSWPETSTQPNAVRVRYVAGYGAAADVPESIKQWMKLTIGVLYDRRAAVEDRAIHEIPAAHYDGLLNKETVYTL